MAALLRHVCKAAWWLSSGSAAPSRRRVQVSELLGSFGDNELSPECLDGAAALCRPDHGVCIPRAYASYLAPLAAPGLHSALLAMERPERHEMPLVCKLMRHALLASPQRVFAFDHAEPPCAAWRAPAYSWRASADVS